MGAIKSYNRKIALLGVPIAWLLFFCFVLLVGINARAGQYTLSDTSYVNKLLRQFSDTLIYSPDKSLQIAEKAVKISVQIKYESGICRGLKAKGVATSELGRPKEAIAFYLEALRICEDNKYIKQAADIHARLGSAYDDLGDFRTAIEHFNIALKMFSVSPDSADLARTYNFLGNLMVHMHDYSKATEYQLMSVRLLSLMRNQLRVATVFSNIAATFIYQKKYDTALSYLYNALHICDSLKNKPNMPVVMMNIALCYDETGKKDSALTYYFKSLDLFKESADIENEAILLNDIGTIYFETNKLDKAEKYYLESLDIAKKSSFLNVLTSDNYNLADLYHKKGDYNKAYLYKEDAYKNKDSLFSKEKATALAELTTKFETSEMEHKNMVLQKENDLQNLRLQRKNVIAYSGFGAALLFLVIGVQVVRQNKLKTNQQKLELEQKQLLAQINPHFIFNCLNSIQQFVVQNDTMNTNKYLADFALLMRQTLDNSKDGLISLRREIEYLENYLSFEHMRFEDKFSYDIVCAPDTDPDADEIPSMIVQPFVENAIRHGLFNLQTRKGLLKISFHKKDGFLICEVDDNGIGMEKAGKLKAQNFIKYQSHGMELTQKRLALVSKMHSPGYTINIINKKGELQDAAGTTIIIKFPLQA